LNTVVMHLIEKFKIGDIVARKSYGYDIFFKVTDIKKTEKESIATLHGISYRIEADAPVNDLELQTEKRVNEYRSACFAQIESKARENNSTRYRGYPKKARYRDTSKEEAKRFIKYGKVLHLDGDKEYLETCLREYERLGLKVVGKYISEKEQAIRVYELLKEHRPDILVLTGHDGLIKGSKDLISLESYRNSKYFVNAVNEARGYDADLDSLVIFAGACQSNYDELIKAGANFASAPSRDLIHALDPVRVCQIVANTGIDKILHAKDVIENTITGKTGIGGVQTRGKCREGFPIELFERFF